MENSPVLVIRKPDMTIHQVPLVNKATLLAFNNRLPAGQKWTFEEMDAEKAKKLPFIDKDYVTAGEAVSKLKSLEQESTEKDKRIADLEKKLAAMNGGQGKAQETAVDVIAKINAATSADDVKAILGDDDRKTVLDAAGKKIASF